MGFKSLFSKKKRSSELRGFQEVLLFRLTNEQVHCARASVEIEKGKVDSWAQKLFGESLARNDLL